VERARQALAKEAEFYVRNHKTAAQVAAKRGNAAPSEWALTHIAAVDDQGKEQRIVAPSVDRQQIEAGNRAPVINIGFLTAPAAPKQLEAANVQVIDVEAVKAE